VNGFLLLAALTVAFFAFGWCFGWCVDRVVTRMQRNDLMALANTVRPRCGHTGYANKPSHRMHACDLHPRHTDVDPMHHCGHKGCGAYWRRAPHETLQIQQLDALYADATEPDRRR
jgi:hypothetical protein